MFVFLLLVAMTVSGCSSGSGSTEIPQKDGRPVQNSTNASKRPAEADFKPADGVVIFNGREEALKAASGMITIYGKDGRPWKVIDHDDDSLGSLSGEEGDFYPLFFSNGASRDFGIEMRVERRSEDWIEVVVHETRNPKTKGYIRPSDPLFKFWTWDEWVKNHFNIRFDSGSNPVLDAPDGKRKIVVITDGPLIRPDEVKGDWVQIRWTKHEPDEPTVEQMAASHPEDAGWIRWRKDGKILIEEYYP